MEPDCRRKIPTLQVRLDAWLTRCWKTHIGREPKDDDLAGDYDPPIVFYDLGDRSEGRKRRFS
jgi:hypothetical protein